MSDPYAHDGMPRGPLIGAGVLIAVVIAIVATVRLSGSGGVHFPPTAVPVAERSLRFEDRADGSVAVYDVRSNAQAFVLQPGQDGFIRATLRTFARERRQMGAGAEVPFRLTAYADGRFVLEDPVLARRVDLEAFGPTNLAAFARLLELDKQPH